jgi:hypothetical protein
MILFVPLATLIYQPMNALPSSEEALAGTTLQKVISEHPGEVYAPFHGYIAGTSDSKMHAHSAAVRDIFNGTDAKVKAELYNSLVSAIQEQRYSAIILADDPYRTFFQDIELEKYYHMVGTLLDERTALSAAAKGKIVQEWIYVPNTDVSSSKAGD